MIRLRLKAFGKEFIDTEIVDGELLSDAVSRGCESINLDGRTPQEIFQVLLNGHVIEKEMWVLTKLRTTDTILIAPLLKDSDGNVLRGVLQIAIIAAATYFLGPAGYGLATGSFALSAAVAAASILGTMAIYALIPPPVPSSGLESASDVGSSQMYSISSQSNTAKPYGFVPKVYGQHRFFPTVAANPYIEIETDPGNPGRFIQTLYAVYDFGLGPVRVDDLRIGDTSLDEFPDVEAYFVDPNKPDVNEGPWDDQTSKEFKLYKSDVESENFAVALNANRSDSPTPPESSYTAIRAAAPNPQLVEQTISLSLVCPSGLFGASQSGNFSNRDIELEIHFAKVSDPVDATNWMASNDPTYVSSWSDDGGFSQYQPKTLTTYPFWTLTPIYTLLNPTGTQQQLIATDAEIDGASLPASSRAYFWATSYMYGFKAGQVPVLALIGDPEIVVGSSIKVTVNKKPPEANYSKITPYPPTVDFGRVARIEQMGSSQYYRYFMDRPLEFDVPMVSTTYGTLYSNPSKTISRYDDMGGVVFLDRSVTGKGKISRNSREPAYATFKFTPKTPGEYKVRVVRISSYSTLNSQVSDALTWGGISTRFARDSIQTTKRHTFLEIKIRATGQLNGAIQNLSGIASSVVDVWDEDTQTWVKQISRNPAWIFADLITGSVNKRAVDKSRLHLPSLIEWANHCDEVPESPEGITYSLPRFQSDFVLDYATTLQGVLSSVAGAAQAGLNIIDGKYGVLLDIKRDIPIQIFTPRNSSNFSSRRIYSAKPHALKVKFVDCGNNWAQSEAIVYDDGYDASNATEFDEATSFACTSYEQAWRFGRYVLAQNKYRQETITITTDFENIVCTRGDYVQITQDVMKVGGFPARVKSITGNRVVIDDGIESNPGIDYGFTFRKSSNGQIFTDTLTIVSSDTFDLDGANLPSVGDLFVIGEVGKIVFDCIVKAIRPGEDMTAEITLVEKADQIYAAESDMSLPEYDPQINNTTDIEYQPPGEVRDLRVVANSYNVVGAAYEYFIDIDWDAPPGSAYENFEVYVNTGPGSGYVRVATTTDSAYRYTVDSSNLGVEHGFKVLAVSANGRKADLLAVGEVFAIPVRKTAKPSDIMEFSSDITGEVLQLSWLRPPDPDIAEYLIRFSPDSDTNATWTRSTQLLRVSANVNLASTQARTGTYLIKAVDLNGNESSQPAVILTTIPTLFGLNVVDELNDFTAPIPLTGTMDRVEEFAGGIRLRQEIPGDVLVRKYYDEGYYYMRGIFDLADIYSVRLQAVIRAVGFTEEDVMSNWITLSSVPYLTSAQSSDWDVEFQYRATNERNTMSDWPTLSSVATMSAGSSDIWTPWRKFTIGDATGRKFQFRLKLKSNKPSVTPRVIDAAVRVDTPDRTESENNLLAPDTGYSVVYDPPFLGPGDSPAIQITIENGGTGDYFEFLAKDLTGFTIVFKAASGIPEARRFDYLVKGYGRKAAEVI